MNASQVDVSWSEHKKVYRNENKKRSHHQIKKRRDKSMEEWKRSGAMERHHGCDEHYKLRTCPACFVDQISMMGCRFSHCPFPPNKSYIKREIQGNKEVYVDETLGIVYYERNINIILPNEYDQLWYDYDDSED